MAKKKWCDGVYFMAQDLCMEDALLRPNSGTDDTCTATPSGYHCYIKDSETDSAGSTTGGTDKLPPAPSPAVSPFVGAAGAATGIASVETESGAAVVLGSLCLVLLLFLTGLLSVHIMRKPDATPMTKLVEVETSRQEA